MRARPVLVASIAAACVLALVLPAIGSGPVSAPSGVTATDSSPTAIIVHWTGRVAGATSYHVIVSGHTTVVRLPAHGAHITGLIGGRSYGVQVRACSSGCGPVARTTVSTGAGETTPRGARPTIGGCTVFPADNAWNEDISKAPVDPRSAKWLSTLSGNLHPDFGSGQFGDYGIPYTVVPASQRRVPIHFAAFGDESDPGPYPIPANARVEGGATSTGDRHVLVVQQGSCKLYEMYNAHRDGRGWKADAGAVFDLNSDHMRPAGWTSADAAGLPITPGLARADEANADAIHHALRFTVSRTQMAYVAPARHFASNDSDPDLPPMGMRVRLKASFDTSGFHGQALAILKALKTYGMILADNGSNWYISGTPDPRWNDDDLDQLKRVPGSAFEAVQAGPLHTR